MTDLKEDQDIVKQLFPNSCADTIDGMISILNDGYTLLKDFYKKGLSINRGGKRIKVDKEFMDNIQKRLSELLDMFADKNVEKYMKDPIEFEFESISNLKKKSSKEAKDYIFTLDDDDGYQQTREMLLHFLAAKINESLVPPNPPSAPIPTDLAVITAGQTITIPLSQ